LIWFWNLHFRKVLLNSDQCCLRSRVLNRLSCMHILLYQYCSIHHFWNKNHAVTWKPKSSDIFRLQSTYLVSGSLMESSLLICFNWLAVGHGRDRSWSDAVGRGRTVAAQDKTSHTYPHHDHRNPLDGAYLLCWTISSQSVAGLGSDAVGRSRSLYCCGPGQHTT